MIIGADIPTNSSLILDAPAAFQNFSFS